MSECEKLLPCPFCGGSPILDVHREDDDVVFCVVRCATCGYSKQRVDEATLIGWWNTRAGGWQPIASAPKDGTSVLVSGPSFPAKHGPYISTGMYRDGLWFEREEMYPREWLNAPTHWQPLPAPPEDKP